LEALPLTAEDKAVNRHRVDRLGLFVAKVLHHSRLSDLRDAMLMLGAQVKPICVVHWRHGLDHLILLRGPPPGQRLEWLD
jgi:hypothetical protein